MATITFHSSFSVNGIIANDGFAIRQAGGDGHAIVNDGRFSYEFDYQSDEFYTELLNLTVSIDGVKKISFDAINFDANNNVLSNEYWFQELMPASTSGTHVRIDFVGSSENDTIDSYGRNGIITAGAGDDVISSYSSEVIYGNTGNDSIEAHGVRAQSGDSFTIANVYAGQGNDTVLASSSYIYGNLGDDIITAEGNSTCYGGQGDDTIIGNNYSADVVFGNRGNDYIEFGDRDGFLDVLYINPSSGDDKILHFETWLDKIVVLGGAQLTGTSIVDGFVTLHFGEASVQLIGVFGLPDPNSVWQPG